MGLKIPCKDFVPDAIVITWNNQSFDTGDKATNILVELALHLNTAQPPPDTSLSVFTYCLGCFHSLKKCPVPPLVLPSVWPQVQSTTVKLLTKH